MPKIKVLRPHITKEQEDIYMDNRKSKIKQEHCARAAKISERSGRDIEKGRRKPKKERTYRTRKDPLKGVWEEVCIPLLKKGVDQGTFIHNELKKLYPERFHSKETLRTVQRRVRKWKALEGEGKEVMFRQVRKPGEIGAADFTHPGDRTRITILGKAVSYILFHFKLTYSGKSYIRPFLGSGESYVKFAQGINEAFAYIGGVPEALRTDSLSAAFKNLSKQDAEDVTQRFKALTEHFGIRPARINKGKSHENGSVESSHRHFKDRLAQRLLIRGSSDFLSFEEFESYVSEVQKEHNDHNVSPALLEVDRDALRPLPSTKAIDYEEVVAVVSCTSTIQVKRATYTVPSRLIKERLQVRVYTDRLECYLGRTHTATLVRAYPTSRTTRARRIELKHVIESLVKKPGAFLRYQFRDDLLPNDQFKLIWKHLLNTMENRSACKLMVGLLHLMVKQDCEEELANTVIGLIDSKLEIKLNVLQDMFSSKKGIAPNLDIPQHSPGSYDHLIPHGGNL